MRNKKSLLIAVVAIIMVCALAVAFVGCSEKGVIIDAEMIKRASLAPNAKRELQLCGLWSKKIRMSDWAGSGLWSW